MTLLEECRIAKLAPGCPSRFLSSHALVHKPRRKQFDVRLDFIAELAVRFCLPEEPTKFRNCAKDPGGHGYF
jgi:hypothetical protein